MDDMVIVAQLRALNKWINGCNMRCYTFLCARENRVLGKYLKAYETHIRQHDLIQKKHICPDDQGQGVIYVCMYVCMYAMYVMQCDVCMRVCNVM